MSDNQKTLEHPSALVSIEEHKETSHVPFWEISITLLVFATLITLTSRTFVDADLWGHLQFGLDNLAAGQISQVDPYSYLSFGQHWINHEWLSEVVFAIFWLASGTPGLVLLKTTMGVLTLGLVYWYLLSENIFPIRAGCLVILGWFGLMTAISTIRPHIFTLLFTSILFIIIAKAESGNCRWLWFAPPVLLLWINFHGGVLAGLGFLGIWSFVHLIQHRQEWRRILPPVIVSGLAVFINPYGIDLVLFLFRTATVPRPEIIEWQPLQLVSLLGGIYLVFLTILILGLAYSKRKKEISIVVLLIVAALMPFVAFRHLPLFALAVLVFGGPYINDAWSQIKTTHRGQKQIPRWMSVISLVISIILLIWSIPNFQRIIIPNQPVSFFPDRAVELIHESNVQGNMAVEFNWGEYVIWHLGPEIQVSLDGRRETVYSDKIYQMNWDFLNGAGDWDAVLDNYDTHMALVYQSRAAHNLLLLKEGWELVYEDGTSALFASQEWSGLDNLKSAANNNPDLPANDFFP